MGRKNGDSRKRRSAKHVEASITLVEHGYQIDVRDYTQSADDKTGVLVSTACHDFGGSYDIGHMAKTVTAALIGMMERLEEYHKKALHLEERFKLSQFESEQAAFAEKQVEDDLRIG